MKKLERYLERKGLELNMDKTKIVRFGKRGKSRRKEKWW